MKKIVCAGFARLCIAVCATAFAGTSLLAWADPPSRVGRISHAEGETSFFSDREEGWAPARLNFPVTSENSLWTGAQGRAEVRVGASALRIDDNTILDFVKIGDDSIDTYLQRGTLNIRSRNDSGDDSRERIRINTREGRFVIDGNGRYRIDATGDGSQTRIAVFAGRVRYEGGGNTLTVDAGKSLLVRADSGATDFRFENASASSFDRWAEARDMRWDETHARYVREQSVSPYMTGYEDLDAYGDWVENREYGRVWTPRVVVSGWTPYRYGSWAYVNPWGWTWVDDAPWGFAPFHYGRWVQIGVRWGWCPGEYTRRPVYAPALVGWMGERPGVQVSVSVGPSVGWFPLAPREYYLPAYTNNITYIRNINHITNNVTIVNAPTYYVNRTPGATFVSGQTFVSARPIQANAIRTNPAQVNSFPVVSAPELPSGTWGKLRARAMQQAQAASTPQPLPAQPAAVQPVTPSYAPQSAAQFAPPANTGVRSSRQQSGEVQRGAPWQERRALPREAVTPSTPVPAYIPVPVPVPAPSRTPALTPVPSSIPAQPTPNGNGRPGAIPQREITQTPNENQRIRQPRNIEPGEPRAARQYSGRETYGGREERNNREERSIQHAPEAIRPAEISRPPAINRPVESHPQRIETPAVAPAKLSPVSTIQAPHPMPRHKPELRDVDGR